MPSTADARRRAGGALAERVDEARRALAPTLARPERAALGQFLTPAPLARFLASMFTSRPRVVRLLDAGAGLGALTAAFVIRAGSGVSHPERIDVTACELDDRLADGLRRTLAGCRELAARSGVELTATIEQGDFLERSAERLGRGQRPFNCAILNPPYRKIGRGSPERRTLSELGIETGNLYAGFVAAAALQLADDGELVAITPRSFCNGPYFLGFRRSFFQTMSLRRIHLFDERGRAFAEDRVLQENVVFAARRSRRSRPIVLSSSPSPDAPCAARLRVAADQVLAPGDEALVVSLPVREAERAARTEVESLPCTLDEIGLEVSTGRVVDFRVRSELRRRHRSGSTAPLLYPCHLTGGLISWPRSDGKKPNALRLGARTEKLLVPAGTYVLVKRFTSREQRRRLVASVVTPEDIGNQPVGLENHLNYFHAGGGGLRPALARGLAAYLNSELADDAFRQRSGHTQVNAADLRALRYPDREELERLGGI